MDLLRTVDGGAQPPTWRTADNARVYLVLLATLVVFAFGLKGSFHFDDYSLFSDSAITSRSGWLELWGPLRTRPLTYFTFWVNYGLGGQNPIGYHAVNLALHLLAVWLLYGNLSRIIGEKAALIGAAIFALHPVQSEPTLYVFERATLICTVFCLLCWRSWMKQRYWTAVGWFVLALLGKEECVTFPFFLLIFQRAYLPAVAMMGAAFAAGVRVIVSFAALSVPTATTYVAQPIPAAGAPTSYIESVGRVILNYFQASLLPYLDTQGMVILRYFRILLLPYGLTIDPDIPVVHDWSGWVAWMAILGAGAVLWKTYRHGRWFAAGLILLAPSSSIFPAADMTADRRLYLPMIALAALAGCLLSGLPRWAVLVPLIAGLSTLSFLRTQVWQTEQRLWSEAATQSPRKVRPLLHLSRVSDAETALRLLDRAQALDPNDVRPIQEKGLKLLSLNKADLAVIEFERALRMLPNDAYLLNNRGVARMFLGQRDAAIEDFRHALSVDSCLALARRNLERLGMGYPVACH